MLGADLGLAESWGLVCTVWYRVAYGESLSLGGPRDIRRAQIWLTLSRMLTKVQGRMLETIDWRSRKKSIVFSSTQHTKVNPPSLHFWKIETSIGLPLVTHGWRSLYMFTLGERPTYFSPSFLSRTIHKYTRFMKYEQRRLYSTEWGA